jgi:hypothetical protein
MMLTAELFTQIVKALRADDTKGRDKRAAPRVGLRAQVEILLKPGTRAPSLLMWCRNLSCNGIGLMHHRDVPEGSEFVARLPAGATTLAPVHLSCVVVHCKKASAGLFLIGARIIRSLSADEAKMLAVQPLSG